MLSAQRNQVSHCGYDIAMDRPRRRRHPTRWLYGPRDPIRTAEDGDTWSPAVDFDTHDVDTELEQRAAGAHRVQPLLCQVTYSAPSRVAEPAGADVHLGLSKSSPSLAPGGKTADSFLPSLAIQTGGRSIRKNHDSLRLPTFSANARPSFRCPSGQRPKVFCVHEVPQGL